MNFYNIYCIIADKDRPTRPDGTFYGRSNLYGRTIIRNSFICTMVEPRGNLSAMRVVIL